MICFQISIFEPLNTAPIPQANTQYSLWFAFKLVSLNHWIQRMDWLYEQLQVVICFQISIFEPLNTAIFRIQTLNEELWFAFKLVSLNHWIQHLQNFLWDNLVVICFQISIFEPLNTAQHENAISTNRLWFAFKLVSLNHWIQQDDYECFLN